MKKAKYTANTDWLKMMMSRSGSRQVAPTKPPKPIKGTQLTILGCGSSTGSPVLTCKCETCSSRDPRNNRLRASVKFQVKDKVFIVDTSPDLRQQAMREKIYWIDAVLYTHPHADHVHGIDELRSFNFLMRRAIPCYGNKWSIDTIRTKFDYIFKYSQEGGGTPAIDLHLIDKPMKIAGVKVTPIPVTHGKATVLGYRINDIAYITDCSYIPEPTFKVLKNLDILVLDCLRPSRHPTHINIEEALALVKKIGAKKTYLTHMSHDIEYREFARSLPKNVYPAHDGLTVRSLK